ncbi:PREDICTED: putative transcription factor bHLH041 isoform X2 [Ipomoea nil]|uniref:putative transcription factor bHLH041 isoform X2 n=1 Tax=Ipomoea nil TaxID=35883 RepID=UPI0009017A01|nr:PREDICTED: putative transcription factor bHLH041 isoform X2 [Ipomoea nil]
MDSIFLLEEGDRIAFLFHRIMQSFGCTYICLWSYFPHPSNYLVSVDGLFSGENSVARRLFEEYRHSSPLLFHEGRIPGYAFKNNLPYMELLFPDLERLASNEVQKQFYREAGIKTAIFMGCGTGEIELGLSSVPQANMEMEMKNIFPEDFFRQAALPGPAMGLSSPQLQPDPNRPSSSSSSLKSLSIDSPESLLFGVAAAATPYAAEPPLREVFSDQRGMLPVVTSPAAGGSMRHIRGAAIDFPSMQCEDAAITRAYLAVISSSSPPPSSSLHPQGSFQKFTAFRRYNMAAAAAQPVGGGRAIIMKKQTVLKRSFEFFRNLNLIKRQELARTTRPTITQVHHMISERKRREKLNESFQHLRSLLPPGTKKDKASVLSMTTEQLSALKAKVEELSRKNQILEAEVAGKGAKAEEEEEEASSSFCGGGRVDVRITEAGESTSEDNRVVDLQVRVRGENGILELVMRLLEFLKQVENVGLISVEANTRSTSVHRIILRLLIQGGELNESDFLEAVRRVVGDLA